MNDTPEQNNTPEPEPKTPDDPKSLISDPKAGEPEKDAPPKADDPKGDELKGDDPEKKEEEKGQDVKKEGEDNPPVITADDVKVPEDMDFDEGLRDKFLDIMNNKELEPKDRTQALVDLQVEAMKAASERASALWQETQEKWQEEVKADTTYGGEKLEGNLAEISKLIETHSDDPKGLREVLSLTGAGNHKHLVGFLTKIAKDLNEGSPVSGSPAPASKDAASILYPDQGKS